MKKSVISLGIVSLFLGAMCIGMIGSVPNAEGAPGDWIERIISDPSENVNSIAIGDADNDGFNDVVIGMSSTNNELRIYTKVGDMWVEEVIDDFSSGVFAVAIGDADNDGFNEIVAGLETAPNELIFYKKDDGAWISDPIANPGVNVNSVVIGDVDNDMINEVVIGMDTAAGEVRAYEYTGTIWNLDHSIDVPTDVNSIAIGDADNDMANEVVIGMNSAAPDFHVRAYEYVASVWQVDNIQNTTNDVLSVAIGDADNDGTNDVVIGLASPSIEVQVFKKSGGSWLLPPGNAPNVTADVNSVAIGDVDNDAKNEILIGMASTTDEVRAYEYDSILTDWVEEIIADTPNDILSVAIGDANGESNMEAVIGMASTTNEVRLYSLDRGELVFVSHYDGNYVSENERFEVFVTSNYVKSVKFYLDDVVIFQDTNDPYQFVLDTTILVDDTTYTIKAEGLRDNAPSLIDTVDVIVKNAAIVGSYIAVDTLRMEYIPDQDVTVVVSTISPPAYDFVDIIVSYTDPSGNEKYAIEGPLPVATQYIIVLPLPSDAELGTYVVSASANGYSGDFRIWEASDTNTFNVSGKNLQELMDDLNAQHVVLNNTITTLSDVVGNEHDFTRSEILARINDTIDELQGFDQTVIDHDTDVKVILDDLEDLVEDEHNLTKNELVEDVAEVLSQIEDLDATVAQEASGIKTNLTTSISDVDSDLAAHDDSLGAHDDNLDSAKEEAKEANEKHDTYLTITMVFLIIALVLVLINLILVNKGYKMMKGTKSVRENQPAPREREPPMEEIENEDEVGDVLDDLGDIIKPEE
jgi:hypothetical protein